jgi:thiamine biosynthesis lipoprotein
MMRWVQVLALVFSVMISGCDSVTGSGEFDSIQGFTQGTTYHITCQLPSESDLKERIDSLLKRFDASLSTYDSTSIISSVNYNVPGVRTDSMFRTVFRESARVYQLTGGAFDITLGPVINAWGFGPGQKLEVDSAMIDSLLQYVGMDKVYLKDDQVVKTDPGIILNVNAIAQGYAVDVVASYLESLGCKNYMVEIGGEIRTRGVNAKGNFWRIGVDRPEFGNMIPGEQLQVIISMHNRSLATSGNYRKFYEKDGVMITHSIDPSTGFPKQSKLLSATVLCEQCITADAYATSCMVLGLEKAIAFIGNQKDADAYLIYGDEVGAYQVWYSEGLKKYMETP